MKKLLICLMLAVCLTAGLCVPGRAEFYAQVYNTQALNIRSGPGTEYSWLGSIPEDGQVRVIGENDGWYQVITLDGSVSGYMSKNFLMPVSALSYEEYSAAPTYPVWTMPTTPPAAPSYGAVTTGYGAVATVYGVVTNTDSLNLRSGPGTEYNWLGSANRGEWVAILGESGNWYRVTVMNTGVSGYMSKNYISTWQGGSAGSGTAVVQNPAGTRFLNLRAYPSYDAQILDIFYNGETCTVISRQQDGWVYVLAYKNGTQMYGYFRGEYLSMNGAPFGGSAVVNTLKNGGNGGSLNLRAEPSGKGAILARIPNGTTVQVCLQGSKWWQVSYNGSYGFVDSGFLGQGGVQPDPQYGNATVQTGNGGKLNLREQPNPNARVLGQFMNGTSLYVLERGAEWSYVQINGQKGYMMTRYLSIRGSSATKTVVNPNGGTYVNLRTTPTQNSNNVNVRVPVGATISILSWGQEWSQVRYGNTVGYMMSWFLK